MRTIALGLAMGARTVGAALLGRALPWRPADQWSAPLGPAQLPAARGGTVPGTEYREGYYRVLLDWSPDDIRAAVYTSSTGWLMLAADLCIAMRGDDRIPAVLASRVMSVQGAPLTFEAAPSGRLRRRALKAAMAEEDWWDMLPETELEELRSWLRLLHVGLGELVWTEPDPADPTGCAVIARIRNGRNVPRLKVWSPRNVRKDLDTGKWWVRTRDGTEVEARPGDGKWVILTSGGDRPWLKGPWRGVSELWLAKKYAREDWARQSERYADGMIWISSPAGTDEDERAKVGADFNASGKRPVYVAPDGYAANLLELKSAAWLTYQSQWEIANRSMAVAILYNDLGTESKRSAGTGANLQGEVRDDIKKSDAASDETELREQVLKPWALANFGNADLAPWPAYQVEPAADMQALATTWNLVAQALRTADQAGYELDWQEIREATGFPITGKAEPKPVPAALSPFAAPGAPPADVPGDKPAAPGKAPGKGKDSGDAEDEDDSDGDAAAQVARLTPALGLRSALEVVAARLGGPLTSAEAADLARRGALAPHELAALFADKRHADARAVRRALSNPRAAWARAAMQAEAA